MKKKLVNAGGFSARGLYKMPSNSSPMEGSVIVLGRGRNIPKLGEVRKGDINPGIVNFKKNISGEIIKIFDLIFN